MGSSVNGTPFYVITDGAGLETVRTALADTTVSGIDCETTGLDPRTDRLRLLSVTTDTVEGGMIVYVVDCFAVDPSPLWGMLADTAIVAHNATFDLGFLAALGFHPASPVHDTMLLSQLLCGTRQKRGFHKLGAVAERELGRLLDKTEQLSDWAGDLTAEQSRYAVEDAEVLPGLFAALTEKIKAAGLERVAEIERRCLPAVAWMTQAGVGFDRQAWDALAAEAKQKAEESAAKLGELAPPSGTLLGGDGWNWDSPEQVRQVFAALGVVLESTDDDALAAVNHPMAELVREYRSAGKLASTYGTGWYADALHDGRVFAGWRQIGADSGRMACKEPNLQNLPRDIRYRRCFAAPPGRVLVKADYSQIELRIACKVARERVMLDAYKRGEDLHTQTAQRVLGVETPTKEQRQLAKSLNFGLLYGMGVTRFRVYAQANYGVTLTEEDAARYRRGFFNAYPGLREWHKSIGKESVDTRTLAGRRRAKVERFTEKLNTPVQGTGADGLKQAMALLRERRAECPGAFPVLVVHDEIVMEADEAQADDVKAWLTKAMLDGMAPLIAPVPVEVEAKIGRTWGGD